MKTTLSILVISGMFMTSFFFSPNAYAIWIGYGGCGINGDSPVKVEQGIFCIDLNSDTDVESKLQSAMKSSERVNWEKTVELVLDRVCTTRSNEAEIDQDMHVERYQIHVVPNYVVVSTHVERTLYGSSKYRGCAIVRTKPQQPTQDSSTR